MTVGADRAAAGSEAAGRAAPALTGPLRALWWLFTNVRFAVLLLALLCLVSLLGVLIPQMPLNVRGDPFAETEWLAYQENKYFGPLTDPMHRAGLFDVFHAGWFSVLVAVTAASTAAYVLSRVPGVWASIFRPRRRVPDRYFELAPQRLRVESPLDPAAVERGLRRRRYRVERFEEGGAVYLFADRFPWAQAGSLLTHTAIIVFVFSAVVSRVDAFQSGLFLHEGATLPVFPVRHPDQIQVLLEDAHAQFTPEGRALEYRSDLVIYRNGEEVKRCSSTVNSPCSYGGYDFFQAAYYGFGAELEVRELATGNVIYRETLGLADRSPAPRVRITDAAGGVVLDDLLVLTDELHTGGVEYRGTLVEAAGRTLSLGLRRTAGSEQWELVAAVPSASGVAPAAAVLSPGETAEVDGLGVTYVSPGMTPSAQVEEIPRPPGSGVAALPVRAQMRGVVYGTNNVAAGDTAAEAAAPAGAGPELILTGVSAGALRLHPGEAAVVGGYEYKFLGQREFAGVDVKRDRSDVLVWLGAALIVAGLVLTFWVPRRRLWAKLSLARAEFAGQVPFHADFAREMRELAAEAAAKGADRKD